MWHNSIYMLHLWKEKGVFLYAHWSLDLHLKGWKMKADALPFVYYNEKNKQFVP